jgi:hypothetical protein
MLQIRMTAARRRAAARMRTRQTPRVVSGLSVLMCVVLGATRLADAAQAGQDPGPGESASQDRGIPRPDSDRLRMTLDFVAGYGTDRANASEPFGAGAPLMTERPA